MNNSNNNNTDKYIPSDQALKFIAFIRASANESNVSPEVHYRIADALFSGEKADRKVLIECTRGLGKALALDELVYTPQGAKMIKDVQIGDSIYDHKGLLTKVINKSPVFMDDTYEVELADGNIITACKDHQWQVFTGVRTRRTKEYVKKEHILSSEYLCSNQWYDRKVGYRNPTGKEQKYWVKLTEPIQYEHKDVPLDPYTVGVILGDGSVCKRTGYSRVTSHNNDIEELMSYIPYNKGVNSTPDKTSSFIGLLGIGGMIKSLGLNVNTYNKFIPDIYKRGSIEQRLELLRGLMDTDGTIGSKPSFGSSFSSCNEKLAKDVQELARSLGMSAKLSYRDNGYAGHYRVYIKHRHYNIFKLKRKADMVRFPAKHVADYQKIKEVRKVATVPTQCISVDNEDKLFVTSGYAVTHNSTTVEYAVIYAAAMGEWPGFGKVPFVAFLGASQEGNVKQFFRNVANKIEKSAFINSVLSVKRVTDNEIELVNADGVEMMIVGRGMSTNFRGLRSKSGDRPTLVIADDILSNEVATSDAIRETIDTNWYNSVIPALDPTKHKVIFIGTPIGQKDLLSQIKESGTYRVEKYPLCSKFPCAESEFDSIWPDRFTYEYTVDTYKQYESAGRTQGFYQEYLLEVTDLSTLLVEEDDIKWYDPSIVLANKHAYNFYISTDFATSTKKSADYSTIAVWAISYNNDWLLVDGQCKRQTMQENIEDLFGYVKKWKPLSVGIESSGQQGGFLSIIEEMKLQRNVWFQFAKKPGSKDPGIRPTKDKVHRFVTGVQPKFKQGKVWFPKPDIVKTSNYRLFELVEEMVNELSKFTMAGGVASLKHDDCGTYDVVVDTPTGNKLLGEIRNGDEVIGFSARGSAICKVKDARITGIKPITNIELASGEILKFSEFHPILSGNTYKLVRELSIGDTITRNTKWKQQLNMVDIHGLKTQEDTTNPQLDVQMEAEKTGFINTCMSRLMEAFQKGTKCITKTTIRKTMTSQILSYCHQQNIKLSMQSRIKLMGISLLITWQQILMKFKHLLRKESQENTLVKIKEEKYQINQSNVRAVLQNLHLLTKHEKILNSAVIAVEMNGMGHMLKNVNVKNVEQYSNLVLEVLATVAMTAEVQTLKEQLKESLNTYAVCAEKHSQELKDKLAVERNAQEIGRMSLSECTDKIKRIWITKPEPTYNFEVAELHNYQVHNGIVVHNCLDLLNQLSEMELFAPSDDTVIEKSVATEGGLVWTGIWEDDEGDEYGGSTIF